jgi:hypothetical protein
VVILWMVNVLALGLELMELMKQKPLGDFQIADSIGHSHEDR